MDGRIRALGPCAASGRLLDRPWIPAAILAACLTAVTTRLVAQKPATGTLGGRVAAAGTDRPVGAVEIVLPKLELGNSTNRRGRFLLEEVLLGIHTLRVEHLGFASTECEVGIHGRFQSSLTVRLQRQPVELEPFQPSSSGNSRCAALSETASTGGAIATEAESSSDPATLPGGPGSGCRGTSLAASAVGSYGPGERGVSSFAFRQSATRQWFMSTVDETGPP